MTGRLTVWTALLDLILPRSCILTGKPMSADEPLRYISSEALPHITFATQSPCLTCGAPAFGEIISPKHCPHCQDLTPVFERGRTLFVLGTHGRTLIHTFKYRNGQWLLPDLVKLSHRVEGYLEAIRGSVLVPVPLHPSRQNYRGYNQSLLIARALAQEAGGSTRVSPLLQRIRNTKSQTRLSKKERIENMQGAFALKKQENPVHKEHYIIVDDVFTTGATLNACAQVLREAGCEKVDIATLAHG